MAVSTTEDDGLSKETNDENFSVFKEAETLFHIALPTSLVQFSLYFIYPETASAVGRSLGTKDLAGFSLASLTGNLTCLTVMVGVLSAADTLMPRAVGTGNLEEVGKLAIRGFVASLLVLFIPLVLLVTAMDSIYLGLQQNPLASDIASQWLRIYVLGVPFVLLFRVLQRFLGCQKIVWPMGISAAAGAFVFHPILLKIFVPRYGFLGSAVAIVTTQTLQIAMALAFLRFRPLHDPRTWQGLSWSAVKEAVEIGAMLSFLRLSLGGVLSFSEWWFWETTCFIIGSLGIIPLDIHTVAYNLIPTMYMIPLGLSIALSIRMGHLLSESVPKAKLLASVCMGFTVLVGAAFALILYNLRDVIVGLFTTSPEVIYGCQQIWGDVCVYIVLLYIFGINSGILRALGMQWRMAGIVVCVLWLCGIPTVLYVGIHQGGGVTAIWSVLPYFYAVLDLLLILCYVCADWNAISQTIQSKKTVDDKKEKEETVHTTFSDVEKPSEDTPLI